MVDGNVEQPEAPQLLKHKQHSPKEMAEARQLKAQKHKAKESRQCVGNVKLANLEAVHLVDINLPTTHPVNLNESISGPR